MITDREEYLIERIEREAKIKMQKVGVPQIVDIINATTRDLKKGFEKVSDEVLPFFNETSKEILKKHGPEEALSRALALITGYT